MVIRETDPMLKLQLPPGFRFYPTDEELLVQYLCRKIAGYRFALQIIGDIDLYKFNPWDLPSKLRIRFLGGLLSLNFWCSDKALFGEKEWYFFSPRDRKYPNGSRPNRVAGAGYWKATGTDKIITTEGRKVGIKKALVFYTGKAPRGTKTNWIMHEYRLWEPAKKNSGTRLDDWVLCRIYEKKSNGQKPATDGGSPTSSSSLYDDVLDSWPELNAGGFFNHLPCFDMVEDQKPDQLGFNWASGSGLGPFGPEV
ncbi:hypothetical protein M569_12388, partial [Genlisea aurea]